MRRDTLIDRERERERSGMGFASVGDNLKWKNQSMYSCHLEIAVLNMSCSHSLAVEHSLSKRKVTSSILVESSQDSFLTAACLIKWETEGEKSKKQLHPSLQLGDVH